MMHHGQLTRSKHSVNARQAVATIVSNQLKRVKMASVQSVIVDKVSEGRDVGLEDLDEAVIVIVAPVLGRPRPTAGPMCKY